MLICLCPQCNNMQDGDSDDAAFFNPFKKKLLNEIWIQLLIIRIRDNIKNSDNVWMGVVEWIIGSE